MAPIRIGFIGLSKTGWAVLAHLPYLKASDKFEIVAIQNSSVASSKEAIKLHGLPETTKAYGKPEDIANDPDVDLVVCCVRVDRHNAAVAPSLRAGKNVYVEWPLGKDVVDAEEIASLDRQSQTFTGLQGRQAPLIAALKETIASGKIGDVLSSTVHAYAGMGGPVATEENEYMGNKAIGGNILTIHGGHTLDYIQAVLGSPFAFAESLLANRRPFIRLIKADGTLVSDHHHKSAEDTIFIHGPLSSFVPVSVVLHAGTPFKGTPGMDWRILGSKGEIRVTAAGPLLQIGYPDQKIEFRDTVTDEVTEIKVQTDEWDKLPIPARNVARMYEGIAGTEERSKLLCNFTDAVERHRLLDVIGAYKM